MIGEELAHELLCCLLPDTPQKLRESAALGLSLALHRAHKPLSLTRVGPDLFDACGQPWAAAGQGPEALALLYAHPLRWLDLPGPATRRAWHGRITRALDSLRGVDRRLAAALALSPTAAGPGTRLRNGAGGVVQARWVPGHRLGP